jgi:16S rRNA (uracil1498-N3)-methyltransferase
MRLHRFYVSQPLGEEVVIEDVSIIKQWLKVFRYKEGDLVILFNGAGTDYTYALSETSPLACKLSYASRAANYIPGRRSILFMSLIKKDLFELVVEKATECGVTDIIPIVTERTEKKNTDVKRLMLISKEAAEQCGRGSLLNLHESQTLAEAIDFAASIPVEGKNTYATSFFGVPATELFYDRKSSDGAFPVAFFVGPEGGWTEKEEQLFVEKNITKISLGKTVLRAETAGITCAILTSLI